MVWRGREAWKPPSIPVLEVRMVASGHGGGGGGGANGRDSPPGRRVCRHCCWRKALRPKGLCERCYYDPLVRVLYESESKYGRRAGIGLECPCGCDGSRHVGNDSSLLMPFTASGTVGYTTVSVVEQVEVGPTTALPGSPAKLAVMARRAELGLPIFHPADLTYVKVNGLG